VTRPHLRLVPAASDAPALASEQPQAPPLEITGLDAGYGHTRILHGLDLKVPPGCVTVLAGANGAGKSTLVRAICGRLPARAGQVRICGLAAASAPARRMIGLAPQEIALYRSLTVAENLAVFAALGGLSGSEARVRMRQVMLRAGLTERQDERIDHLSGGWARRVNLAAALMGAPRLLLLDEPTVGVDAPAREALAALVRTLADQGLGATAAAGGRRPRDPVQPAEPAGLAVLLVTHDFDFAERVADRIALLAGGRIALEGPLPALLEQRFAHRRLVELSFAAPPPAIRSGTLASLGLTVEGASAHGLIADAPRAVSDLLARLEALGLPPLALTLKTPGLAALYGELNRTRA